MLQGLQRVVTFKDYSLLINLVTLQVEEVGFGLNCGAWL